VILNIKEEPLDVALGVYIVLKDEVILAVSHPDHCGKVTRLKARVET
jgi:hypothetical protein